MRKILIATPLKGGLTSCYLQGFVNTMRTRFEGVTLEFSVLEGPAVNLARNELAHYAKAIGARELVFIDADLKWTVEHFTRLISHADLDIVGGIYCKKVPGNPHWLMNAPEGGLDPDADLCEVDDLATGFMKIRCDTVFPAIDKAYPELAFHCYPEFQNTGNGMKAGIAMEYFPMGVTGPRSARTRLDRVKKALEKLQAPGMTELERAVVGERVLVEIDQACHDEQPPGMLRGEDYYFCHLARSVGIKVYADFGMAVLPHIGQAAYPITPEMVGVEGLLKGALP